MKNYKFFIAVAILLNCAVAAQSVEIPLIPSNPTYKSVQNVPRVTAEPKPEIITTSFDDCVKIYDTNVENLFLMTLAAINASGFKIDEIQSQTGLISFEAGNKSLLVSVTKVNPKTAMIKITPMDNSYTFPPLLKDKIFTYLSNNIR